MWTSFAPGSWGGRSGLSQQQVDRAIERSFEQLNANGDAVASGVPSGTTIAFELLPGRLLTLFRCSSLSTTVTGSGRRTSARFG
jgi:hypothetical protein